MSLRTALAVCLDAVFGRVEKNNLQDFLQRYPNALDLMVAARQNGGYTPEMIAEHLGDALAAVPPAEQTRELFRLVEFLTATTQTLHLTPLPMMGGTVTPLAASAPAPAVAPTADWPPANAREGSSAYDTLVVLGPETQVRSTLQRLGGSIGALRKLLKKEHKLKLSDPYFRSLLLKYYGLKASAMEEFLGGAIAPPPTPPAAKTKRKYTRKAKSKATDPEGAPKNISQLVRRQFTADDLTNTLRAQESVAGLAKYINALPEVKKAGFSLTDANCSMLVKSMTGKRASDILGNRRLPKQRR